MMKTKAKSLTWTGDLRAALGAVVLGNGNLHFTPSHFNDKRLTCRRIKFSYRSNLSDLELDMMQKVIQGRRPELNVTVSRWDGSLYGNYVVYYRPKVGVYMNH